jgi:hypothetical protein
MVANVIAGKFPMFYRGPAGVFAEYICMAFDSDTHEAFAVYYPTKFMGKGVASKEAAALITLARWEREWTAMQDEEIERTSA